jgi:hypothetical protein
LMVHIPSVFCWPTASIFQIMLTGSVCVCVCVCMCV